MPRMAWESAGDADEMHIPRPTRLRMTPNVQGQESDFGTEGPRGRCPDLKAWALGIVRPTCRGCVRHLALLSAGTYKAKFTFLSADVQSQVRPPPDRPLAEGRLWPLSPVGFAVWSGFRRTAAFMSCRSRFQGLLCFDVCVQGCWAQTGSVAHFLLGHILEAAGRPVCPLD